MNTLEFFQEIASLLTGDILHVKRGTGIQSDKKITFDNLKDSIVGLISKSIIVGGTMTNGLRRNVRLDKCGSPSRIRRARKDLREALARYHAARAEWYGNRENGWRSFKRGRSFVGPMPGFWSDSRESEQRAGVAMDARDEVRRQEQRLRRELDHADAFAVERARLVESRRRGEAR